jgi:Icc-related predicted phosphoesterase
MNYWEQIPLDINILITHGPVAYKLDYTYYDKLYVGCEQLRYQVEKIKPLLYISGHIHEGYGYEYDINTHYFNASVCNINYEPINEPWVIDTNFESRETNGNFI